MFAPPCLLSACGFSCLGVGDVHLERHLPPVSPPTHRGPLHPSWPHPRCLGSRSKVGPQGSEQLGMGTENENPEPDCQKQFQAAVSVIQNLPKNGWKEQVLNGDAEPAPEPPCLPKEPAPPSPESQPPRDQDSEVFCDSMEQLEPELQVGAEQRGALGGELNTRNSTESPAKKGRLESTLLGPQELDTWLVGTVRALQESMRDVQGRLQSLESMPVPRKQRPRPGTGLSVPTLLFFLLWPFIVQWLFRQFRTQKR
ncbi:acyl-CoA-binding domain-containing protein 4 isoform X8 [Tursiops truncatus]|uniref:acyl-CoA-binding domain-containing protein 4 isoform X8 n=1 Tax=Tursiops truncatus TaxID=9739 RepID=UPI003CCF5EF6